MQNLKKLLDLLTLRERRRAVLLLGMIMVMALLDMIGVASFMPFMAVLTNPELVQTNMLINKIYIAASLIGISTTDQFLLVLGALVFSLIVVSLSFKMLTTYVQLKFALMREYSIGRRLLEGYLRQPYSWFLGRHSADIGKVILSEVNQVITTGMRPLISLVFHGAIASALLILLILVDPRLAFTVGVILAAAYMLIYTAARGFLAYIGKETVKANLGRFSAISETVGALKEVKVRGLERAYVERFSFQAYFFAWHQTQSHLVAQLPRFALEAIAFGGILLLVLYLMARGGDLASALPVITIYAVAGYRLMPALQQIYVAVTQLRFAGPAINALHEDLMSLKDSRETLRQEALEFRHAVTLKNIVYRYPNSPHSALKGVSLSISIGETVGLMGVTGSGKTTVVDLILGLLEAQQGTVAVDGLAIAEHNRRAWQLLIGYVPQQIYLADDTVAANIAFGLDPREIDAVALERAAKIANLHEFIQTELPEKYQTKVGERGVRLSGGQRQRIGIARALYHNPKLLIMDEATSGLDNLTEQKVMEALRQSGRGLTIILISHRLSTLKSCDTVILLEKGEIKANGTFDELMRSNHGFRSLSA